MTILDFCRARSLFFSTHLVWMGPLWESARDCKLLQSAKNDLIRKRQLAKMDSINEGARTSHLNQLKGSVFVSKKYASMKSQAEFEWANH